MGQVKKSTLNLTELPPLYKCTSCGKTVQSPKGTFYMSKTFSLYDGNEHYSHICCGCVNAYFEEMKAKYKDEKLALLLTCCTIGVYFSDELYESVRDNGEIKFGNFIKALNGTQYRSKNFVTFLTALLRDGSALRDRSEIVDARETRWNSADHKNKNYVLHTIGYDCFEDESYSDANRKFLFNTLADYLTDDVVDDPHKLQCVIALVKTTLQVDSIDKMINAELKRPIPDTQSITQLSSVKEKLARSINSSANENGISAKTSGKNGRGANALTKIMKEMAENGYEEIKVNVIDAKMSIAYQEISKQNAKALFNELALTGDEFAEMVADQAQMITKYQDRIMLLEEENRKLRIEKLRLEQAGGDG